MAAETRVVHVTTIPESLGFLDGQLRYLRAQGFEFFAISSPGLYLDQFASRQGITAIPVRMQRALSPLSDLVALAKLARELRRLRPAIVHSHTPKAGLLGTLAGLIAGVPVRIYHMRGLPLRTATGLRRELLRWTERIACAAASRVIVVSPSLRETAISERLCDPNKLAVLANGSGQGVDAANKFDPDRLPRSVRDETRARLGIPSDAIVIGFLGRLAREKGIAELCVAFAQLAERDARLHLLVAGGADERDGVAAKTLQELDSHPRIHRIEHDWNSPPLYAASDIIALPTYREGFPNVPLEAAAMKKPVVSTRVDGCVDAVVDGETGLLVAPRDSDALAAGLARYIESDELRAAHGAAGRARVLKLFSREQIWDALHGEYTKLVAEPRPAYSRAKRVLDATASVALLATLGVPMLGLGAVISLTMGSPAIFSQLRPGADERLFRMYKFRTMTNARDASGELLPDAQRITRLGAFLRRTSLDELPELFNVLRGEMSLVGPRPLLVKYLPHYSAHERQRHSVLPGITGWAQLHGRNLVSWDERLALDVWYVSHRSLRLDLEIMLATILMVLRRDGVVVDPQSIMLNFDEERLARHALGRAPSG